MVTALTEPTLPFLTKPMQTFYLQMDQTSLLCSFDITSQDKLQSLFQTQQPCPPLLCAFQESSKRGRGRPGQNPPEKRDS